MKKKNFDVEKEVKRISKIIRDSIYTHFVGEMTNVSVWLHDYLISHGLEGSEIKYRVSRSRDSISIKPQNLYTCLVFRGIRPKGHVPDFGEYTHQGMTYGFNKHKEFYIKPKVPLEYITIDCKMEV